MHARNLHHVSIAMWDGWATYDGSAETVLFQEEHVASGAGVDALRSEAISHAAYRILRSRFATSPGAAVMLPQYDRLMDALGYDRTDVSVVEDTPAAIGNRIAQRVLEYGAADNSNEANDYANLRYAPINQPLLPDFPGNPAMGFPNRWQPLSLQFFIDQAGNPIPDGVPEFLSPEWGIVPAWALSTDRLTIGERDGFEYWVYEDPGPPPLMDDALDRYRNGFEMVSVWSSHLDPSDGVLIDASPNSVGNAPLASRGHPDVLRLLRGRRLGPWLYHEPRHRPAVRAADGAARRLLPRARRVLGRRAGVGDPAGPLVRLLNDVADHPSFVKRLGGTGPVLGDLEWCVKAYLAMGGAMHDSAIAAWGVKGWYDYPRPVSVIRYLSGLGQRTDPNQPGYHPGGINLHPGFVEVVTAASTAAGERHEHLAGNEGKIAVFAWRGPTTSTIPLVDVAGCGWILAENWWPYQRPTFVTPPFAGYVSGHSTYSRAAAVVMDRLNGTPYFPDGLGEYVCPAGDFLVFEDGPSVEVRLQWASYYDASDQCSLSRIWGGIHPPADDLPGRQMGQVIGHDAVDLAEPLGRDRLRCVRVARLPRPGRERHPRRLRGHRNPVLHAWRPQLHGARRGAHAARQLRGRGQRPDPRGDLAAPRPVRLLHRILRPVVPGGPPGQPGPTLPRRPYRPRRRRRRGAGERPGSVLVTRRSGGAPQPNGTVVIQPGDTCTFQAWHRDVNPGVTSNFTGAKFVTFD